MSDPRFIQDKAYRERVQHLLLEALMLGLKDPETSACVWRTGEIVEACMNLQAMLLASSPVTDTPTKLREYAESYSKALGRRVQGFRAQFAAQGAPFPTMVIEGDLH